MGNSNAISILNSIKYQAEDAGVIQNDKEYIKCNKDINDILKVLRDEKNECWSKLDESIARVESIIEDIAFEQGFKTAIKLIFSSLN